MNAPIWPICGAGMMTGSTWHGRRDGPANAFAYDVDYLLLRMAPKPARLPFPLGNGRFAPLAYSDRDHGDGRGPAVDWARACAIASGLPATAIHEIWLLTLPRQFGHVFNPISLWFFRDADGAVRAVLAEVNNTYGDRHAYFCARDDQGPLEADDWVIRPKRMHVSPFQDVAGAYAFRFRLTGARLAVAIEHRRGNGGMTATLTGDIRALDRRAALGLMFRRPLGGLRVYGLIHWQALVLKLKGAAFRPRPAPPREDLTR